MNQAAFYKFMSDRVNQGLLKPISSHLSVVSEEEALGVVNWREVHMMTMPKVSLVILQQDKYDHGLIEFSFSNISMSYYCYFDADHQAPKNLRPFPHYEEDLDCSFTVYLQGDSSHSMNFSYESVVSITLLEDRSLEDKGQSSVTERVLKTGILNRRKQEEED